MPNYQDILRHVGFYMVGLAPVFVLASKIDFHSLPGILVGAGAIVASIGSTLSTPPGSTVVKV